jgi:hypothetical protein
MRVLKEIQIVPSGHLAAVAYDEDAMELYVQFKNGSTYVYSQVAGDVVTGFSQALSSGQYFHEFVKNGGYEYKKLA